MNLREIINYYTSSTGKAEVKAHYSKLLEQLDELAPVNPKLKSEDDYLQAKKIKSLLSALFCYSSNTSSPQFDEICERENQYGRAMARFNKRLEIKDSLARIRARYLVGNFTIPRVNSSRVIKKVHEDGNLRKVSRSNGQVSLYVVGLNYKVGNNVFVPDARGREHRLYMETIGRQAIPLSLEENWKEAFISSYPELINEIPELCDTYHETSIGDGKGLIKNLAFRNSEVSYIAGAF